MNKTILTGRLGDAADKKHTGEGKPYATFSLAVEEYKKEGENTTKWFNCSAWGERFTGKLIEHLNKGTKVLVEGKYSPRIYTDRDGKPQISHDFIVGDIELLGQPNKDNSQTPAPAQEQGFEKFNGAPTDDLPF